MNHVQTSMNHAQTSMNHAGARAAPVANLQRTQAMEAQARENGSAPETAPPI